MGASLVNTTNGPVESKSHEGAMLSVEFVGWCLITGGFPHLVTASNGVMTAKLLEQGSILATNSKGGK
jgi:hypothetical protein